MSGWSCHVSFEHWNTTRQSIEVSDSPRLEVIRVQSLKIAERSNGRWYGSRELIRIQDADIIPKSRLIEWVIDEWVDGVAKSHSRMEHHSIIDRGEWFASHCGASRTAVEDWWEIQWLMEWSRRVGWHTTLCWGTIRSFRQEQSMWVVSKPIRAAVTVSRCRTDIEAWWEIQWLMEWCPRVDLKTAL